MSAATQTSVPSRVAVRTYQIALIVLSLALAAVTALAIYFADHDSTATAGPTGTSGTSGTSGTVHSSTYNGHPCWEIHLPC